MLIPFGPRSCEGVRGSRAIKRAIVPGPSGLAAQGGNDESRQVNRAAASCVGMIVNVAASCQGSNVETRQRRKHAKQHSVSFLANRRKKKFV